MIIDAPAKCPLKTLCAGAAFARTAAAPFPAVILAQTADFTFTIEPALPAALERLRREPDIDLLLLDADDAPLPDLLAFAREARRLRPDAPLVAFSARSGDRARYLLREGAAWQFTKGARELTHLACALRRHLPAPAGNRRPDSALLPNPYVVGRPLAGPAETLYVGREEVFAWLAENLHAPSRPNALLLHGQRRVGKTSTLYQVAAGRRGDPLRRHPIRPLTPVYIDLQRLAGCHTGEWLCHVAGDVAPQAHANGHTGDALPDESPYAVLERALDRAEAALPAGGLLLIAVDELEQLRAGIEGGRLEPELLPFLRAQMQHRERTAFLLCGGPGALDPFWRPLLDLCARRELGPLDRAETEVLVRGPLAGALTVEDEAVERIWDATAGHPLAVQTLCHRLVSLLNEQGRHDLRPADVAHVLETLIAEDTHQWLPQSA
ncbi:hypothetical protein [Promineifilum sp.]|uniref:hypothetical protein n=1 Tax=Promineifilum sp. TaxID=2664178 RepID=UPI0035B00C94